ncbi:MAG: hypothetical protein RCO49_06115 [Rickettsia endosymbiont of Argas persicus]
MINNQYKQLTSREMYEEARQEFLEFTDRSLIGSQDNKLKVTENNIKIMTKLYEQLKVPFFFGQADAAYYLSEFYYNGWLFEEDTIKGDFIIAIGKNCSAPSCINISYRSDNSLPKDYKNLAIKCTETLQKNKQQFKNNIDKEAKNWAEFYINKVIENTNIQNIFIPPIPLSSELSKIPSNIEQVNNNSNDITLTSSHELDNTNNQSSSSNVLPDTQSNASNTIPQNLDVSTNSIILRNETEKTELEPTSGSIISQPNLNKDITLEGQIDSMPISGETPKKQGCYCDIL